VSSLLRQGVFVFAVAALASGLATPEAGAQVAGDPCSRFRGVKSWQLTFTAGFDHENVDATRKLGTIRFRASGFGVLEAVPEAAGWVWRGTGAYSVSSATRKDPSNPLDNSCNSRASDGGTALPLEGLPPGARTEPWMLTINQECEFELFVANLDAEVEWDCFYPQGAPTHIDPHGRRNEHFAIRLSEQPLPERGLLVHDWVPLAENASEAGTANVDGYADNPWDPGTNHPQNQRGTGSLTFTLAPDPEKLELIVEPRDYDTWTPEGNLDPQKPGNHLALKARLQRRGGGAPQEKARRMRFELTQVSREPGVAMNHPPRAQARRNPDLRFRSNPQLAISDDGLSAATHDTGIGGYTEAEAELSSFDWGAWGELRVVAVMGDGREILGHLATDPRPQILLPKRRKDSRIPDVLRASAGLGDLPDDNDGENDPMGDEFSGDGLTLYEEYRGFYENSKHVRSSPMKKDLFVLNKVGAGAKPGIALFARETGLRVRHELLDAELGADRVINANHGEGPHLVDQHAVRIEPQIPPPSDPSAPAPRFENSAAQGGPGTPEAVARVLISGTALRVGAARLARTIAHELGHSVNVFHHGQGDLGRVFWRAQALPGGGMQVTEGGTVIQLRTEDGQAIPVRTAGQIEVWVADARAQHSGVEDCFMRYDVADAYRKDAEPGVRYWVKGTERRGAMLCESREGTGVNARERQPRPRYGDADDCAGSCKRQLRVSDEGDAPSHRPCARAGAP
jgi:hypothetical protein